MIRYTRSFNNPIKLATGDFLTIGAMRRVAPAIFTDAPHESRSNRYGFIPTEQLLTGLISEGFYPVSVTQARSREEGKKTAAKHLIRFRHASALPIDGVSPEVVLLNSHDGSSSYKLMAGLFRMVCSNGLIAGEMWGACTVPHTRGALERVIEGSFEIIKKAPELADSVHAMQGIALSADEQRAYGRAALALRYDNPETAPVSADDLNAARRVEDRGPDLWRTLNRTQENIMRGGVAGIKYDENGRRRRTITRPINGIDQSVSINRGLWVLAEEMRKLKAA